MRSIKFHALRTVALVFFPMMAAAVTPTPSPTPIPVLPDLEPVQVFVFSDSFGTCLLHPANLHTWAVIQNHGGAAGAFTVEINGQEVRLDQGLPGDGWADWIFVEGYSVGETKVVVDSENEIVESNEENNTLIDAPPIPTPLPTCSPTPSPTATYQSDYFADARIGPHDLWMAALNWRSTDTDSTSHPNANENLLRLLREWRAGVGRTTGNDLLVVHLPNLPEGARPLRMVKIPSGRFLMGAPTTERSYLSTDSERPVREIRFDYDFYLGETEVTQAQWFAVMGSLPERLITEGGNVGDDVSISYVHWEDAQRFLRSLSTQTGKTFRLPSESEWEYSCRAGTRTRFYFGESLGCEDFWTDCETDGLVGVRSDYMHFGWREETGARQRGVQEVAKLRPNPWGLYDMSGNVAEWCEDLHYGSYDTIPTDGKPQGLRDPFDFNSIRSIRGGSGTSAAWQCRSASRRGTPIADAGTGFRVVMEINPPHK